MQSRSWAYFLLERNGEVGHHFVGETELRLLAPKNGYLFICALRHKVGKLTPCLLVPSLEDLLKNKVQMKSEYSFCVLVPFNYLHLANCFVVHLRRPFRKYEAEFVSLGKLFLSLGTNFYRPSSSKYAMQGTFCYLKNLPWFAIETDRYQFSNH